MKNAFDGLLSTLDAAKKRISELADRAIELTQTETQRKREVKAKTRTKKQSTWKLWSSIKCSHIWLIAIPEGKERNDGEEGIFLNNG